MDIDGLVANYLPKFCVNLILYGTIYCYILGLSLLELIDCELRIGVSLMIIEATEINKETA